MYEDFGFVECKVVCDFGIEDFFGGDCGDFVEFCFGDWKDVV